MTWQSVLILLSIGLILLSIGLLLLSIGVELMWYDPIFVALFGALLLVIVVLSIVGGRRQARLAADRQGESICTFARAFDCRAVDTWVIRAVFEELEPYCTFGRHTLPLRPTDDLDVFLRIDSEELDDIVEVIAYRAGRSLEAADCVKNPLYGNVKTVADLVAFFVNQPPRSTAWPRANGHSG